MYYFSFLLLCYQLWWIKMNILQRFIILRSDVNKQTAVKLSWHGRKLGWENFRAGDIPGKERWGIPRREIGGGKCSEKLLGWEKFLVGDTVREKLTEKFPKGCSRDTSGKGKFLREISAETVRQTMSGVEWPVPPTCKFLSVAVMICATLVNTQTHTQTATFNTFDLLIVQPTELKTQHCKSKEIYVLEQ